MEAHNGLWLRDVVEHVFCGIVAEGGAEGGGSRGKGGKGRSEGEEEKTKILNERRRKRE